MIVILYLKKEKVKMKKVNKSKVIIPALAMIALTTAASATGTVAWFSMNTVASVNGMVLKTTVNDNLLIDNYVDGSWATNDSTFAATKTQTIETNNILVPVSTVNGYDFFYTMPGNVAGNGDASTNTYVSLPGSTEHATNVTNLKTAYSSADDFYLDYHLVLKADNTSTSARNINVSTLELTYSTANKGVEHAWRVAVFANKFTTAAVNGAKTAPGYGTSATKMYAPAGYAHFEKGEGVEGKAKAVSSTSATSEVIYASSPADSTIATIDGGKTEYFEVVVRAWLEGEDTSCTVETFKTLDDGTWNLNCGFTLESGTASGAYQLAVTGESAAA